MTFSTGSTTPWLPVRGTIEDKVGFVDPAGTLAWISGMNEFGGVGATAVPDTAVPCTIATVAELNVDASRKSSLTCTPIRSIRFSVPELAVSVTVEFDGFAHL